jgi:hypothetical protein
VTQVINWLQKFKVFNILLILIYFIAVVLPHKRFGTFLNEQVFKGITRDQYNQMVLFAALILLAAFTIIFLKNSATKPFKKRLWAYMALNIILAALTINILFVINIEVIHFPQYACFAILCFPLLGNYHQALIWATIAGSVDEAYQYFYLAPKDTSYYDFNDVVTNLIGAVFGLLLLRSFGVEEWKKPKFFKSSALVGLIGVGTIILIACLSGYLSIYPSEDTPFQLLRKWPEGFWSTVPPEVTFHVMRPIEGTVITGILLFIYQSIGKK